MRNQRRGAAWLLALSLFCGGCAGDAQRPAPEPGADRAGSFTLLGQDAFPALDGQELRELAEYFCAFAEQYAIFTLDMEFSDPSALDEHEKYRLFLFLQDWEARQRGEEASLEQSLYSAPEQACVVPVPVADGYLEEYLGIHIADPAAAMQPYASTNYRYDPERGAFIVPSLSGFGGYRPFYVLDAVQDGDLLSLFFGWGDPDDPEEGRPDSRIRLSVRLQALDPLSFRLLAYETLPQPE